MRNAAIFLVLIVFLVAGCATAPEAYVAADESTYNTVGVEWLDMTKNAYRLNDEGSYELWKAADEIDTHQDHVERAERKMESWKARIDAGKEAD